MFIHELPSAKRDDEKNDDTFVDTKLRHVFIECDWYRQLYHDPTTGLRIIEYEPYWDGSKIVMLLARCCPTSCVFWPLDPFSQQNLKAAVFDLKTQKLNVILYHETAA
jgi:hypothetical protein